MHDKRRRAVYYYCCVVIVVGGCGIFIIVICLHLLLKDERDRILDCDINNRQKQNNVLTTRIQRRRQWHYRCNYNLMMTTMALMRSRRRRCHGRPITLTGARDGDGGVDNIY